eukprot:gene34462-57234_t
MSEQPVNFTIKTGFENMDMNYIHKCLSLDSYWSKDIPFETVKLAFKNSFCVAIFENENQVGFARLVTDYATFAYLADVFVDSKFRGKSYGKQMVAFIMDQDWVKNLRRLMLATQDAHELYHKYGFKTLSFPNRILEITKPG